MAQTHTTVSILADVPYMKALRAVAADQGVTVGQLIRNAADSQYGTKLKRYQKKFAHSEDIRPQLETIAHDEQH